MVRMLCLCCFACAIGCNGVAPGADADGAEAELAALPAVADLFANANANREQLERARAWSRVDDALTAATPDNSAPPVGCGDELGPGYHRLDADLVCATHPAVVVHSRAYLDLAGHRITCNGTPATTGILVDGADATVAHGRIQGCNIGIWLADAERARVRRIRLEADQEGIRVQNTRDSWIVDTSAVGGSTGVDLQATTPGGTHGNILYAVTAHSNFSGVALLSNADRNVVAECDLSRNAGNGIALYGANENIIALNRADATFGGRGGTGIILTNGASRNVVVGNSASSRPGQGAAVDGINIGCAHDCVEDFFVEPPTTGATGNVVRNNVANGNSRFGIAQAHGNGGNRIEHNQARNNGVANFEIEP